MQRPTSPVEQRASGCRGPSRTDSGGLSSPYHPRARRPALLVGYQLLTYFVMRSSSHVISRRCRAISARSASFAWASGRSLTSSQADWNRRLSLKNRSNCCQFLAIILPLSLIHISEPTRRTPISYAVFCLKKKKKRDTKN